MKQMFTIAAVAATMLAANAADLSVYNNGQIAPGVNLYNWWNASMDATATNPDGDAKVLSFKSADGSAAFSAGLAANGTEFVTGPLHNATLNFGWYATGTMTCTVRLTADTGAEENYTWTVSADDAGKWQTLSLPVASTYPTVATQWNEYKGKGAGYVFSAVFENASEGAVMYFDNIRYTDIDQNWTAPEVAEIVPPTTVPAITQNADDVLSVFSPLGTMAFNVGYWGQSTQSSDVSIDGKTVAKLAKYNYLGWEFAETFDASDYDYMHVDFYPCEESGLGFTPISEGPQEKVWTAPEVKINQWNSYDAPLTYFSNVDLSKIFQVKFDGGQMGEVYLANVYFWKDNGGGETPEPVDPSGAKYTGVATGSYEQTMDDTKEYPYTLNYSIVYNEDKTLTVTGTFDWTNGEPVGMVPGSVFINNELNDFTMTDGVRTVTTTTTYEPGTAASLNFYIPVANGVVQVPVEYVVGTDNSNTGVSVIEAADAAPVYYNLQGQRVANPERGIYIRVAGGKATKVMM